MSEERLTVSELLARSGKPGEAPAGKRRRRSMEEGGVSVAELTGSTPVVNARPAASKHHTGYWKSEDVRAGVQQAQQQSATAQGAGQQGTAQQQNQRAPQAPGATRNPQQANVVQRGQAAAAQRVSQRPATASQQIPNPREAAAQAQPGARQNGGQTNTAQRQPVRSRTGQPAAASRPGAQPAAAQTVQPQSGAQNRTPAPAGKGTRAQVNPQSSKPQAANPQGGIPTAATTGMQQSPARPATSASPSDDETIVLQVVDERDPIRLTTGEFPAIAQTATGSFRAQDLNPQSPVAPAGSKQVVTPQPAQRTSATPSGAQPAIAGPAQAGNPTANGAGRPGAAVASPAPAQAPADRLEDQHLEEFDDSDFYDEAEENSVNIGSVIMMSVIGIVLGVAIFVGFEQIWQRLSTVISAVAALVITVGIAFGAYRFGSDNPKRSAILGAITAALLTFGPMFLA